MAGTDRLFGDGVVLLPLTSLDYANSTQLGQWLKPCFSIFDKDSSSTAAFICEQLTYQEKVQAMDYCRDILNLFDPIIREDGTHVGTVETLCNHLLLVSKLFPTVSSTDMEYIFVETLLVALTQLPSRTSRTGALCRVILQLCKKSPTFPPVLALGTSILYQLGTDMDTGIWRILAQWLSFHLINTKLGWPYWNHWAEDFTLQNKVNTESKMFLDIVVGRCSRALLPDIVRSSLPQSMHCLIPNCNGPFCPLFDTNGTIGKW
jgi:hypothetical protein